MWSQKEDKTFHEFSFSSFFFNQLYKISLKYWLNLFERERGLGKGNNRTLTYSYLLQGSKGFTFVMPLGTLSKQSVRIFTLIPLGMPTNRKPSSLRVNRELEIFWEPTVFNSAWLVSVLRTHGVSQSACLRPWPVASHIPLWLHQLYVSSLQTKMMSPEVGHMYPVGMVHIQGCSYLAPFPWRDEEQLCRK